MNLKLATFARRFPEGVLLGAIVMGFCACQMSSSAPTPSSTTPSPSTPPPSTTSKSLTVTPSSLNFGNITVGSTAVLGASLTANTTLSVSSASWNGSGYALSGITFPVTLTAGQTVPFKVSFTPQAGGAATGTVSFISDSSNSPTSQALTGTGVHNVSLKWNSSSTPVAGYNVYRATQSGGPYTRLNSAPQTLTSYSDSTVQAGLTYYYVTTAVNASAVESAYSNEAVAAIPVP